MVNVMLIYEEAKIISALDRLSDRFRTVFALLCATRLLPAYRRFHSLTGNGDPPAVDSLADRLWADCLEEPQDEAHLQDALERIMALIPTEAEGLHLEFQATAEDAVAALAYAYRARLIGSSREAAWAARRAYEARDTVVEGLLDREGTACEEPKTRLSHPFVQRELAHQQKDLERLAKLEAAPNATEQLVNLKEESERNADTCGDTDQGT